MSTLLWMLASTAAGWLIGTRTTKQQIDEKFQELERRLAEKQAANGQSASQAAVAVPAASPTPAAAPLAVTPATGVNGAIKEERVAAPAPVAAQQEEVSEEVLMVLSAAIAAFMGKRARIKRVRRVPAAGFNPWSQQGRVYIQGSHNIAYSRRGE